MQPLANFDTQTVFEMAHDGYTVRVLNLVGFGEYDFQVMDADGKMLHESECGYGQPLPAIAGAHAWIVARS